MQRPGRRRRKSSDYGWPNQTFASTLMPGRSR
jgi:hypothetical protein